MHGRKLGFDGKTLIHPSQVDPCNAAFAPSTREIAEAEALIARGIRIALAQFDFPVGDVAGNAKRVVELAERAVLVGEHRVRGLPRERVPERVPAIALKTALARHHDLSLLEVR